MRPAGEAAHKPRAEAGALTERESRHHCGNFNSRISAWNLPRPRRYFTKQPHRGRQKISDGRAGLGICCGALFRIFATT
jgi:hypothetical protein